MKNKIITLVLIVLSLSTFGFDIPSRPNRLMNDYIGLLTSDQVQALETKLVAFDNKTSIQIAIVILDDLDGEDKQNVATDIGENWGVGQKGQNNGIVFLIVRYSKSAKEKLYEQRNGDWFIAPGYGLEPYITDYDAKSIGESQFIPFAKEDKYYEGIDATISTIMSKLGEIGWQQRQELEAKEKAEHDEAMRKFGNGVLMFIIFAAIFGVLIFLFVKIRKAILKAQEIKRRRETIKKSFEALKVKIAYQKKFTLIAQNPPFPSWALLLHNTIVEAINVLIDKTAQSAIDEFPSAIETNMVRASQLLNVLTNVASKLETEISNLQAIPTEILKYQEESPVKIAWTNRLLLELKNSITAKGKEGYNLLEYQSKVQSCETEFAKIKRKFDGTSREDKDVCEESEKLSAEITTVIESLQTYLLSQKNTEAIIKRVNIFIEKLPEHKQNFQTMLDKLKKECPNDNWKDLEAGVSLIPGLEKACIDLKKQALEKNTMDVQDFTQAENIAQQSEAKMNAILTHYHNIHLRQVEITQAEADFDDSLKAAETAIASATTKTSDSDVKQGAKTKLAFAEEKLKAATSASSESLINWLFALALLTAAKELADEAYTMAGNDIEKAKNARTAATAAIAATAAAALAKKKADDEPSKTYYHSSPSPSDTGGGFGGFGGGSFGGGGAGGSW